MTEMAPESPAPDTCRICRTPTRDHAYYCDNCRETLDQALGDCAWVDEELDTTITRQKSAPIAGATAKTSKDSLEDYLAGISEKGLKGVQIPWHGRASDARRDLHAILVSWVKFCRDEKVRGFPAWSPHPPERPTIPSLARWLLHCTHGLSLIELGPDAHDEITSAVDECKRIVFWKKRSRVYLGPCEENIKDADGEVTDIACQGEVYADEGEPVGACDSCDAGVTVVTRRDKLNKELDGMLFTAADIAKMAVHLGLEQPRDSVRKKVHYWHRHNRIEQRGRDSVGDPMFRYGDVRMMLYAEFARKVKS